jgi:hypothetical protein
MTKVLASVVRVAIARGRIVTVKASVAAVLNVIAVALASKVMLKVNINKD